MVQIQLEKWVAEEREKLILRSETSLSLKEAYRVMKTSVSSSLSLVSKFSF